ncbi:MAG: DUF1631 family protein [Aquabacterium sp.]|uniref:DUF1631 family protein n=1 Tax=Aquabacterium sp. TaxID=1872578 RepID=UPI00120E01D7|nr:DUF1631 family protein [Aquabacterium sp.]TAK94053.1 MAG: DUF1631 family protein [Aquabacterium sp.]
MADLSPYQQHVQSLLARSPELARLLVHNTQEAMRASSADLAMAADRSLLFQVAEIVQAQRSPYEHALASHIKSEIEKQSQPESSSPSLTVLSLDELTLVDEAQAEQEIEVSRTVQLIDLAAEWELRELQAFTSTLQGETRLKPQDNPARPAVFAKALSTATRELPLADNERHMLLRISGKVLADLLKVFYAQTCEKLRQQGWSPQAYKAVTTPRAVPQSDVNVTQPGALHSLLEKLPVPPRAHQTPASEASPSSDGQPALTFQALGHAWPPGTTQAQTNSARSFSEEQVFDLLNRLFAQMHRDQELQPAICNMIDQLQPAVMRVARNDPQVLRSAQHPAWQLINQLAAYASGYSESEQADQAELAAFLSFIQPRIQQLVRPPGPTLAQLDATLADVQRFIEAQSQAQLQAAPQAVTQLQEADLRLSVRPILLQQVEQQLATHKLKTSIRDFLLGPWVDVLSRVMASMTPDEDEVQAMMATVDDLLHSLQRPVNMSERESLRQSLPGLIGRLKRGMASIALPTDQQDAILDDLMGIHTHHLLSTPKATSRQAEPSAEDIVANMRKEMRQETRERNQADEPSVGHSSSARSHHPQLVDTNLGSLPTVPMAYGEDMHDMARASTPMDWADALQKGMWCKLFLQGQWTTAHLLWISANRQFYMFTSERAGRMHSMTRRALERLRAEGLATDLEDRSLMQRAVDSMLQDLHD